MSRINTNIAALISSRYLNQNNAKLNTSLERLSTGYRINRGSDDPAGLIASENLRSEMAGIKAALTNAERANSIVATAEGALSEVSDLLVDLQGLAVQSANSGGLSGEEIRANQLQVDGILESIDRIASQTSFNGERLLDGSKGFSTSTADGEIQDISVNMAKNAADEDLDIVVTTATAATRATTTANVAAIDCGAAGTTITYEITGSKGSATVTFADGATAANVASAINALSAATGVIVSNNAGAYRVRSKAYGADEFVRVEVISGTNTAGLTAETVEGTDAVVTVNGVNASVDGNRASVRTGAIDISFTMVDALIGTAAATDTITIAKGGGATFQLSQNVGMTGREVVGIPSVSTARLGSASTGRLLDIASGGSYDLQTDAEGAQDIIEAALQQVATARGRLGSFVKDTVQTTINSLNVSYENVAAADSVIRETDFAKETAQLTRNQILVNASTSVLSIANTAPQSVLALIG
ncbi:MAG: flagellin [Planctomycetes bacterium]|nr:flagellin [Planctomycetota bacterium]